jgi:uncharacterized protein YbbK (DUF523 family)
MGAAGSKESRLRVGVSACLLGDAVRYDGGHKYEEAVARLLADVFVLVAVCPEVEIGLGVPRETVQLVERGGDVRMVASKTGADHTETMRAFARARVAELEELGICGYVFKKSSPSCGLADVPVGGSALGGRGLFAAEIVRRLPDLPVAEEPDLRDAHTRARFIAQVLEYARRRSGI